MVVINIILGVILWNLIISSLNYKFKLKNNKLYCGMVGFSSTEPFDVDKIKTLILWNSLERGIDATGLYSPLNGLKKKAIRGSEFIVSEDPDLQIIPDVMLMAHCRAKTVGVNCIANTHPFKRGNWILQHNGTLKNYYDIRQKYNIPYLNFDVDSDILCEAININNNLTPLKEIDGPAAVIINNPEVDPLELIIFRNDERPLFKGYVGNSMYISSIKESLTLINCINIKEFKKDRVYYVKNGIITKSYDIKNTPYKHVYQNPHDYSLNNNTTNKNVVINYFRTNEKFLNSWVRYNSTIRLTCGSIIFEYDKYYLVKQVLGNGMLEVYDPVTKTKGTIWYSNFESLDIITKDSYCKALYNIYKDDTKTDYSVKMGQILYCSFVDSDQDSIRVNDGKDKRTFLTYTNKEYFVKLTEEELKEFMESNNKDNESPFIDTLPENQQFLDVEENNQTDEENEETEDSLSLLCNHLEESGNLLDELNLLLHYENVDPKTKLLVVDLINLNDKAKSQALFLYDEDDNELEEEVKLNHE